MAKIVKKEKEAVEPVNFLRQLLSTISHKTGLSFGINDNCRLIKIDNTERKREGEIIKRNTFLTFGKFNDKNELIAQTEFNYFNLDPAGDYTFDNLVLQLSQLTSLCKIITGEDQSIDPVSSFKTEDALNKALKDSKGCKTIQEEMYKQFSDIISEFVGNDGPLLRFKVVTDKNGKYLQLPKDAHFCELMSNPSTLKISLYELKTKEKGLQPTVEQADPTGDAPAKIVSKKAILNL